ncbi:MAG: transketolase [Acidiferrobacteraceae bacterium]|nr:transketolase [Acidiferrobacteraceae bacterium]
MRKLSETVRDKRREKANAIRALSMDAVQRANSGHPGMPMGMADIAEVLWSDFLRFNPRNPNWIDRDRFIVSNGHGSMLHYALLHLTGYDLPLEELKNFRQLHSRTPGHPEYGDTPGIETTTGPLGQGLGNAVGLALAEKILAGRYNREGCELIDHHTWVLLGDGCLMEGISHEACSLAGTLGLDKLIAIWDNNGISIDGDVQGWFTDDTPARFRAYGWRVIEDVDGHDPITIKEAINAAVNENRRPTLICCKTVIGWGSPNKQGKESCHGAPLGLEEIDLTRETIGWHYPPFEIPEDIYQAWDAKDSGSKLESEWKEKFEYYKSSYPDLAAEFERRLSGALPVNWAAVMDAALQTISDKAEALASRKASQRTLELIAPNLPELIGGSADLTGSNLTSWPGMQIVSQKNTNGNYIFYGVREFGMAAISNGLALHGGFIPFCATFLTFSDYARNALRMSALMKIRSIFVFTHDSIGLGEDGPTHQPVEHAESLRLIPNMVVWRPCDALETIIAWRQAIERVDGPTCLLLSRQKLPYYERSNEQVSLISRGGYVLRDCSETPEAIIVATGSEVALAVEIAQVLAQKKRHIRVVSMPSTELFDQQESSYRSSVFPESVKVKVAIEAGTGSGWNRYVGSSGYIISIDTFGASAPAEDLFRYFGLSVEEVMPIVESAINN